MSKKILLVDDEEEIIFLLKRRFIKNGYDVVEAHSGVEAIACVEKERPDLIVLDVMMPGMNGLEVCRKLKSDPQYQSIKIVLLTAKDQQKDKELGKEAGADAYMTKPFEPDDIIGKVKSLVG